MRARGLLVAGLLALAVAAIGITVVGAAVAGPTASGPWGNARFGGMGGPWMAAMGGPVAADARPIGIERAAAAAEDYLARFEAVELGEVMEFAANYYAVAIEGDTGVGAFELLIDKYSGFVYPEMGPNMVWNTRYGGMHGPPHRGWRDRAGEEMPIGGERARELVDEYFRAQGVPIEAGEVHRFHGYYTFHTTREGEIEGMISVNGFTGEVWYHVWHGPFVRALEAPSPHAAP